MKSTFRRDIEGLRAVAVMLVVAFHFGATWLPGGFVGVDIFFVISGYLISLLLVREISDTGRIDLINFYGRRARRLLPAALLVSSITLAISHLILSPMEARDASRGALWATLYTSNLWFVRQSLDYFAPSAGLNPFLHTWSLGVEEQFYFIWPALIFIVTRFATMTGTRAWIAVIILISFVACLSLVHYKAPWAFFLMPTRIWEFGAGAVIAVGPAIAQPKNRMWRELIAVAGLLSIAACALTFQETMLFPSYSASLPVMGTALLLLTGEGQPTIVNRLLNMRVLQATGRRSYSLYLWHWPVIVLARAWWGTLTLTQIGLCLVTVCVLAWASYSFVETPVRKSRWLQIRRWRSIHFAVLATVAGTAICTLSLYRALVVMRAPYLVAMNDAVVYHSATPQNGHNCLVDFFDVSPTMCRYGRQSRPRVVLFGDSHAAQWLTPMRQAAELGGYSFVTALKAGCPALELSERHPMSRECAIWRRRALEGIRKLRPAVIVFTQAANLDVASGFYHAANSDLVTLPEWQHGLDAIFPVLLETGARIILLRDTPAPAQDVPRCLGRQYMRGAPSSLCDLQRHYALNDHVAQLERRTARKAGAEYVDLSDLFCGSKTCPAILAGHLVYRDASHITDFDLATKTSRLHSILASTSAQSRVTPED